MKFIWTLFLSLALLVAAHASATQVRSCCPDEDCGVIQCIHLGCMSAAMPAIPQVPALPTSWKPVRDMPEFAQAPLPERAISIWTPPD
ncbi:MAG: hypothetical protein ACJ8GW_00050 [Massilia sp.]